MLGRPCWSKVAQLKFLPTLPPIENVNYPRTLVCRIDRFKIRPSTGAWFSPPRREYDQLRPPAAKVIYANSIPLTAERPDRMAMVSSRYAHSSELRWSGGRSGRPRPSSHGPALHRPLHRAASALPEVRLSSVTCRIQPLPRSRPLQALHPAGYARMRASADPLVSPAAAWCQRQFGCPVPSGGRIVIALPSRRARLPIIVDKFLKRFGSHPASGCSNGIAAVPQDQRRPKTA